MFYMQQMGGFRLLGHGAPSSDDSHHPVRLRGGMLLKCEVDLAHGAEFEAWCYQRPFTVQPVLFADRFTEYAFLMRVIWWVILTPTTIATGQHSETRQSPGEGLDADATSQHYRGTLHLLSL